jgi:hypothetical protein
LEVIMMLTRRAVVGSAAVATTAALALGPDAAAASGHRRRARSTEGGQAVLDWEQVSFDTVYGAFGTPLVTPIPVGVPVLGFVSVAMYRAATRSAHLGNSSESAAVARAARDVLLTYYPGQAGALQAALDKTMDAIRPGQARTKGSRIGADAARDMIESRQGDHYLDGSIPYNKPATAPYWQPATVASPMAVVGPMLAPWLGSLRNLVVEAEPISGPYSLGSTAWADDYEEIRAVGNNNSAVRTPGQTATALFHNSTNSARTLGDSIIRYLGTHPLGIIETARMFAHMHGAITDSVICTWQQKRDVGFWRPFQAISGVHDDGNAGTIPQPGWTPLVINPPYSDYLSGHGCLTSPQVEVIRRVFGEDTSLELRSPTLGTRTYAHLSEIEHEAFHARIWGGLHYRKAMRDTYEMGHRTAVRVMAALC